LLKEAILSSDVIVYDINSLEETTFAINSNYKLTEVLNGAELEKPKTFIAISSIMTWSKTKIEAEEAEPLTEDEYRRRKPHPNFKDHLALEKEITKAGKKTNLKTYIIAAGMIYHAGESLFHHMFKVYNVFI
jgi:adenylate kinase